MIVNKSIYEDGSGGRLLIQNNSIKTTNAIYVMIYIRLFGGNREASTTRNTIVGEFNDSWWGNDVNGQSKYWMNSETERVLQGIPTTTKNKNVISQAVLRDLSELKKYGKISADVSYPQLNRIKIIITVEQESNSAEVVLLWDATKNEIIGNTTI